MKTKKSFTDGYKRYDTSKGFGNADEWRHSFNQRFTTEEAERIIGEQPDSPHQILGVPLGASAEEIKAAFKEKIMFWHPDKNSSPEALEMSKRIIAAYTILKP